jgi:DNA helicase-2/ATP-dependent DNA helicase PcrA
MLPYDAAKVDEAGRYFDQVVARIQAREFDVKTPPEPKICKECDLRLLCHTRRGHL